MNPAEAIFPYFQINVWERQLNDALPLPLREIEVWLREVEELMEEEMPVSQSYSEAMTLTQEKMTLFKVGKEKETWSNQTCVRDCS